MVVAVYMISTQHVEACVYLQVNNVIIADVEGYLCAKMYVFVHLFLILF